MISGDYEARRALSPECQFDIGKMASVALRAVGTHEGSPLQIINPRTMTINLLSRTAVGRAIRDSASFRRMPERYVSTYLADDLPATATLRLPDVDVYEVEAKPILRNSATFLVSLGLDHEALDREQDCLAYALDELSGISCRVPRFQSLHVAKTDEAHVDLVATIVRDMAPQTLSFEPLELGHIGRHLRRAS